MEQLVPIFSVLTNVQQVKTRPCAFDNSSLIPNMGITSNTDNDVIRVTNGHHNIFPFYKKMTEYNLRNDTLAGSKKNNKNKEIIKKKC